MLASKKDLEGRKGRKIGITTSHVISKLMCFLVSMLLYRPQSLHFSSVAFLYGVAPSLIRSMTCSAPPWFHSVRIITLSLSAPIFHQSFYVLNRLLLCYL